MPFVSCFCRWQWKHKSVKGAIILEESSGEVCCLGSREHQQNLYDILKGFTQVWDQPLEMTKERKKWLRKHAEQVGGQPPPPPPPPQP